MSEHSCLGDVCMAIYCCKRSTATTCSGTALPVPVQTLHSFQMGKQMEPGLKAIVVEGVASTYVNAALT